VLVICVAVAGCFNLAGDWTESEVSRVTNPAGSVDAVLFAGSAGATTGSTYKLFVVPRGQRINPEVDSAAAIFSAATRSDSASRVVGGVNLRWKDRSTLHIEHIYLRYTRDPVPFVKVGPQAIHIVLQKGVANTPAPSGGTMNNPRAGPR
jgi:hypothetical protein